MKWCTYMWYIIIMGKDWILVVGIAFGIFVETQTSPIKIYDHRFVWVHPNKLFEWFVVRIGIIWSFYNVECVLTRKFGLSYVWKPSWTKSNKTLSNKNVRNCTCIFFFLQNTLDLFKEFWGTHNNSFWGDSFTKYFYNILILVFWKIEQQYSNFIAPHMLLSMNQIKLILDSYYIGNWCIWIDFNVLALKDWIWKLDIISN